MGNAAVVAGLLARAARYVLALGWEVLADPKAERLGDVPARDTAVTPAWLTAVLCAAHPEAHVVGVALGSGSAGSTVRRQFLLDYDAAGQRRVKEDEGVRGGLPASVFAKLTPTLTSRLAYGGGAMADEACFFNTLRPRLGRDFEAPWGHHASYDLRTGRSVQLLEDLVATRGATFGTPQRVITRAQADEVVTMLATLHATFAGDPRLDAETPLRTVAAWYRSAEPFRLDRYHAQAMEKAAPVIPPRLHARRAETWPAFLRSVARHAQLPQTLLHSDVHLGNWYVTAAGAMGLADWGCVMKGHWARDFAYAVSGTLTVENRRAWERELLARYLERRRELGDAAPSFDDALLLYRQQLFQGLLMWTPTLCHSPLLPDMQPEAVSLEMIRRTATAIDDWDALDSL